MHLRLMLLLATVLTVPAVQAQLFNDLTDTDVDILSDITDAVVPGVTNVRLGVGPVLSPDYEGADSYGISPKPMISLQYRDLIQIDNNNIRINIFGRDGLFDSDTFKAGPLLKLDSGRDAADSPVLSGLGEVGRSIELGVFVAAYVRENIRTRLRLQQDVTSGHSGTKLIGDIRMTFIESETLVVTGSASVTWADNDFMDSFFSINPQQSLDSGIAVYDAGSGLKSVGLAAGANYSISRHWAVVANLGYSRLLGDAGDSPIVSGRGSANQFSSGLYAVYVF